MYYADSESKGCAQKPKMRRFSPELKKSESDRCQEQLSRFMLEQHNMNSGRMSTIVSLTKFSLKGARRKGGRPLDLPGKFERRECVFGAEVHEGF